MGWWGFAKREQFKYRRTFDNHAETFRECAAGVSDDTRLSTQRAKAIGGLVEQKLSHLDRLLQLVVASSHLPLSPKCPNNRAERHSKKSWHIHAAVIMLEQFLVDQWHKQVAARRENANLLDASRRSVAESQVGQQENSLSVVSPKNSIHSIKCQGAGIASESRPNIKVPQCCCTQNKHC